MVHHNDAFTLTELLVTVTLIALAAAVIVPQIGASQDWARVPAAGRQVLADMNYLQNYAISTQRTVWVYVITDPNGNNAYTAATFSSSVTPVAPTYAQATSASGSGFVGMFVPGSGPIATTQPSVGSRMLTRFGGAAGTSAFAGPCPKTLLNSVVLDSGTGSGTPINSFGFDYTGQPISSAGPMVNNIRITITSMSGTSPSLLYIHPLSGEITANAP